MRPRPRRSVPLIAGAAAVAAAALLAGAGATLSGAAARAMLPALAAIGRATDRAQGWMSGATAKRLAGLESERRGLLAEVANREEFKRENELLYATLALRREGESAALPAGVIGVTREGRDEFLILDRGTAEGASVGDIVVDSQRILGGTVVEVSPHSSRAILLSSASRSIDVVIPTSNLRAIARGANVRELIIELVPSGAEVAVGDLIVASPRATGGRRGLAVGRIREVRRSEQEVFKTVRATHLFDPAEEGVIILLAP